MKKRKGKGSKARERKIKGRKIEKKREKEDLVHDSDDP